jgi:hypothetical protein
MVVVVEALAEREHPEQPHVRAGLLRPRHRMRPVPPHVRGVADEPVARQPGGRPRADAHGHPARPQRSPHGGRQRQHVQRPRALQEAQPGIAQDVGRQLRQRAVVRRVEAPVQVPDEVPEQPVIVGEVRRAVGAALPVVAHGVQPRPAQRPAQPRPGEQERQHPACRRPGLVGPMDHAPVQSHRVPRAKRQQRQRERDAHRRRVERGDPPHQPGHAQAPQPQRPEKVEAHAPDLPRHRIYEHVHF